MSSTQTKTALDQAMHLFWHKGFFNTSIDDIVKTTGMNRAAIYTRYKDKQGFFLAVLKQFKTKITHEATLPIQDASCGIQGIKDFFLQFSREQHMYIDAYGCLLFATASDAPSHQANVTEFITNFINELKSLFTAILTNVIKPTAQAPISAIEVTDYLIGNVAGIMTLLRSKIDKAIIQHHIKILIQFLTSLEQGSSNYLNLRRSS